MSGERQRGSPGPRHHKSVRITCVIAGICITLSSCLQPHRSYPLASFTGTVVDGRLQPIEGARVTFLSEGLASTRVQRTERDGTFACTVPLVANKDHLVAVSLPGYRKAVVPLPSGGKDRAQSRVIMLLPHLGPSLPSITNLLASVAAGEEPLVTVLAADWPWSYHFPTPWIHGFLFAHARALRDQIEQATHHPSPLVASRAMEAVRYKSRALISVPKDGTTQSNITPVFRVHAATIDEAIVDATPLVLSLAHEIGGSVQEVGRARSPSGKGVLVRCGVVPQEAEVWPRPTYAGLYVLCFAQHQGAWVLTLLGKDESLPSAPEQLAPLAELGVSQAP